MTAMELLEVMGSIRDPYIREAHEKKKGVSKSRVILIAAIVALMLLLVVGILGGSFLFGETAESLTPEALQQI